MCRMFAVASDQEVDYSSSWRAFCLASERNADGWGLYGVRASSDFLVHEVAPAAQSALARDLATGGHVVGRILIGHLRDATVGVRSPANTHPFIREVGARRWVMAHQGDVGKALEAGVCRPVRLTPRGGTDSEAAFCSLLEAVLAATDPGTGANESAAAETEALGLAAGRLAEYGQFNFLLTDGSFLYAYCTGPEPLNMREEPGWVHFRSEPVNGESGWRSVPLRELVVVKGGRLAACISP